MSTGKSNKTTQVDTSLNNLNVSSNVSQASRTSKSAKAAESLLPIKIEIGSINGFSTTTSNRRPSRECGIQDRQFISPSGPTPASIEDILPWEYQDYDQEVALTTITIVSQSGSQSAGSLPSPVESTRSSVDGAIKKLPSPEVLSPNMKAYQLLGLTASDLDNPTSPFPSNIPSSKSQQILADHPPLPIKQSSATNITQDLKSPSSPFKTQFWSKPGLIDTKMAHRKDTIQVLEEFSASSITHELLLEEPESAISIKRAETRNRSQSSGRISQVQNKRMPFTLTPAKEAFLLSRCIRVYDNNETGHTIDINSIMNDAKQIRDKVYQKVTNSTGAPPNGEYELYIRTKDFNSNRLIRDTSIDDLTLLEICHNPDHPYRSQLEFDKKRHPRIAPIASTSHKKEKPKRRKMVRRKRLINESSQAGPSEMGRVDSLDDEIDAEVAAEAEGELQNDSSKLRAFFGEHVETAPSRRRRRKVKKVVDNRKSMILLDPAPEEEVDEESKKKKEKNGDMSKLVDFFGENLVATVANSKLADFFGENEKSLQPESKKIKKKKVKKERLESSEIAADEIGKDSFGTNSHGSGKELDASSAPAKPKAGSKKLEAFFGDRPPQELIAKNLEAFFPGLQALKDNEVNFQDAVKSTAENKRTSKIQKIQLQMQERKRIQTSRLQLDLGFGSESIMESLESVYEANSKPAPPSRMTSRLSQSPNSVKKRPGAINLGRNSNLKINFELIEFPEELGTERFKDIATLVRPGSIIDHSDSSSSFRRVDSKENIIAKNSRENLTSRVEDLLNLSSRSLNDKVKDMPYLLKTESTADFFEVFAKSPDVPRSIKWIQGPLIGMGSFGKVFYGANCDTGEIMAVKQVLVKNPSLDSRTRRKMLEALHTEIALLKDLDHPNIVRYLGYYTEKDVINVFLEYVSGGSVISALALMGPFDEILVKSLITQVLQGIDYLHECHIIHRDIKGGNILIDDDGTAKISDFGISKKNRHLLTYDNNSVMSVQGTVYWMAPEVIKGKGYSAKVDIWSAGCVVLEMLTCKHPWQNLDEIQTLWRLGRYDKPPIPNNLSPEATSFLGMTFETDAKLRPTANALLDHQFCLSNVEDWNFKAYKEAAILKKQQLDLADAEDDDDSDEDYSEDEDEEEDGVEYEDDDGAESDEFLDDDEYEEYDTESLKRANTID